MKNIPHGLWLKFDRQLDLYQIPGEKRGDFRKWLRYYLDFCHKYEHAYGVSESLLPFLQKLKSKGQSNAQCGQATASINLYHKMLAKRIESNPLNSTKQGHFPSEQPKQESYKAQPSSEPEKAKASWQCSIEEMQDQIQMRHYSPRTLRIYTQWTRKFQRFTQNKNPDELETEDVKAFLTDLAVHQDVAASTQNQAFNALLFFYRHGLGKEFGKVDGVVRAKCRRNIPVVLSRAEVEAVLSKLEPPYALAVKFLYGCGLRISECVECRVQNFNLEEKLLTVRDGKGQKDRVVPLPSSILLELEEHLDCLRTLHDSDLTTEGVAGVFLPKQIEKKYRNAAKDFVWQWFFPAPRLTRVKGTHEMRRWHLQQSHLHKAIKEAASKAKLTKRVTAHTFRHSFASHLLKANVDIRTIQEMLGHSDVKTTMIYTHTLESQTIKERRSPLDL